ncbi:glutamate-cysteine ligase family protein [Aureliella helgolandensis]|uniref:Carboxylate-amine ligase YbdK n=1 Tax=Aureliella helgolandensis TaxID=2527968 RepID=A0A518G019_9BACT|nr:glutamate-cysteine ligase family protein [Aureliella helgolandensis]QDV21949.1 Carboxylate-amine ligase YbdK [Aureliella helgolandensis]
MSTVSLGLFEAFGIEMEYMLVDRETLEVRPVADKVLAAMAGHTTCDVEIGPISWSNELALHVIELKTTKPKRRLRRLPSMFETAISEISPILDGMGLCLLPSAVHPWMNATTETRLWPHEYHEIYETYDRIFNCRTHGWSNVQSVHLNLPFKHAAEFAKLHAAVRLVLPLLPALAASSPVLDGKYTGLLDTRMNLYADHCRAVPSLTGNLIPEPIFDEAAYRREIFTPIANDIGKLDPQGQMEVEFLNARGAIARFDRGSIELRVMDVQEYPAADVSICAAVTSLVRALCDQRWLPLEKQQSISTADLRSILDQTTAHAENATIEDAGYLQHFGIRKSSITAGQLWSTLLGELRREDATLDNLFAPIQIILESGTLATRITHALGPQFSRERLADVYRDLADCLHRWVPFQSL